MWGLKILWGLTILWGTKRTDSNWIKHSVQIRSHDIRRIIIYFFPFPEFLVISSPIQTWLARLQTSFLYCSIAWTSSGWDSRYTALYMRQPNKYSLCLSGLFLAGRYTKVDTPSKSFCTTNLLVSSLWVFNFF